MRNRGIGAVYRLYSPIAAGPGRRKYGWRKGLQVIFEIFGFLLAICLGYAIILLWNSKNPT
jgi:hypothetical protein